MSTKLSYDFNGFFFSKTIDKIRQSSNFVHKEFISIYLLTELTLLIEVQLAEFCKINFSPEQSWWTKHDLSECVG